jgi:hypothetical protein
MDKFQAFKSISTADLQEIKPDNNLLSGDISGIINSHIDGAPEMSGERITGGESASAPDGGQIFQASQNIGNTNIANLITGKLAVQIADVVFPALIVIAVEQFSNANVKKSELKLSANEREMLEPLFDAYMKSINIQVDNPLSALLIGLGIVYGTKAIEIIGKADLNVKAWNAADPETTNILQEQKKRPGRPFKNKAA